MSICGVVQIVVGWHPTNRNSGGLLSIWDSSRGSLTFTFSGGSFLRVCLEWVVKKRGVL